MEHFTSLSMVLFEFLPQEIIPEPKKLLEIFGRMSVNSFNILDTDMTSLGVGIYLGPSILDHSCKPNATAIFEGTKLLIRTLCDLESLDWSKVIIVLYTYSWQIQLLPEYPKILKILKIIIFRYL